MSTSSVIKEQRIKKNLKQEDVAKAVGVTVQTYSKWENGKTEPKASQVKLLSDAIGLSEREICRGKMNQRYSLEEFIDEVGYYSANKVDMEMTMILWRNTDDHERFIKAIESSYKDDVIHRQAFINKLIEEQKE